MFGSKSTSLVYPGKGNGHDNEAIPEPAKYRKNSPSGESGKEPPHSISEDREEDSDYEKDQIKTNVKQHVSHMINRTFFKPEKNNIIMD